MANGKQFLQDENGNYYAVSKFYAGEQYHPMIMRDNNTSKTVGFSINGSIYGDFTPIKGLTVTSRFGYRLGGTRNSGASLPLSPNRVRATSV